MAKNTDPLANALNKEATTAAIQEVSSTTIDAESIWITVFSSILSQTFQRGAAYFIGKESVLQKEFQLAFKTADFAAVEYMRLRDRHGDPLDNARSQLVTEKASVTTTVTESV